MAGSFPGVRRFCPQSARCDVHMNPASRMLSECPQSYSATRDLTSKVKSPLDAVLLWAVILGGESNTRQGPWGPNEALGKAPLSLRCPSLGDVLVILAKNPSASQHSKAVLTSSNVPSSGSGAATCPVTLSGMLSDGSHSRTETHGARDMKLSGC